MPQISIILPTYNEHKNVPILLERLNTALAHIDKEVIVVDDNSPDQTWKVARDLEPQYPWLRVIRRLHDKGLSSAVLAGFAVAEGDFLAVMDADLQHDENALPNFLTAFAQGADIVVGSRKVEGGGVENWNIMRRFISWVATMMAQIALHQGVTDPMSGFFAIRKELYQKYREEINPRGFKILLEFVARSKEAKVKEVGYTFKGRIHGESKLSGKVIYDYIYALYELSLGKYIPLRFIRYVSVGFTGLIVSYVTLLIARQFAIEDSTAVSISIEASILTNFIFNNYWTFKDHKLTGPWNLLRGTVTFHAICLGGALINQALAIWTAQKCGINLYAANALGYIVAAIWNYVINVSVTWKTHR